MARSSPDSAVRASVSAYGVAGVVPGLDTVEAGTNLLVTGPPMTGKSDLALDLLAAGGEDDGSVVVSSDRGGGEVLEDFGYRSNGPIRVVDCAGRSRPADDRVEHVSSPGDLTGVGIGVVKATRALGAEGVRGVRAGTLSVSTLLQYSPSERIFSFLHVLAGRFAEADYLGVYTLDPSAHEERAVNSLRSLFDAEVAIRETETGREVRVRGVRGAPSGWQPWEG